MKRSSKAANQRGGKAQHEHRRQDGWTSTRRGSDDGKKGSELDRMTGKRSTPKEEKQRLKDLSKSIKKCIREKKNEETARHSKNP